MSFLLMQLLVSGHKSHRHSITETIDFHRLRSLEGCLQLNPYGLFESFAGVYGTATANKISIVYKQVFLAEFSVR
ncbi:hypothetical protein H6F86_05720 [Phormidium sp. FACHB-592]|uniref:Uncharacterized protein n=1 Tax=Stenomitos frigidus AS-A4 TaxID=2933935 RepID=A0ABV0KT15_9CYAN|nr:hypothetical protein [Phormidium sp. FACHB-592]MBD2073390.1 hypothetical protein [Phormidium sp. FACHB-592]